ANWSHENVGIIMEDDSNESQIRWWHAVANIAFGGLVPQAERNLVNAVMFTVSGTLGTCIKALDALIDKMHRECPHYLLFGQYVGDRVQHKDNFEGPRESVPYMKTQDAGTTFCLHMPLHA